MDPKTENYSVTDATRQRAKLFTLDVYEDMHNRFIAAPPGYVLHSLESSLNRPLRQKGRIKTTTPHSFVGAVKDGSPDMSRIYVDELAGTFTGVLNHGTTVDPGWGDYIVTYAPAYSVEFKDWYQLTTQGAIDQIALARFLEDHLGDVCSMPGGEMLALVRDFKVSMAGAFGSATNLSNGSIEFSYAMENKGRSSIEVPEVLVLGLPMFEGTEAIEIPARFRYRLNEAKLTFSLELAGFQRLRVDELRKIRSTIAEALAGYPMLDGAVG